MWTWFAGAAGVVITGWLLQQFSKGGLRWRALTTAQHELDVAAKTGLRPDLAEQLQSQANRRIERYLREPLTAGSLLGIVGNAVAVALLLVVVLWGDPGPVLKAVFVGVLVLASLVIIVDVGVAIRRFRSRGGLPLLLMRRPPRAPSRPGAGTPPAPR